MRPLPEHGRLENGDCATAFLHSTSSATTLTQNGKYVIDLRIAAANQEKIPIRLVSSMGVGGARKPGGRCTKSPLAAFAFPDRSGLALCLQVYLYVYVVEVNKVSAFLWITPVYREGSTACRSHNRM